MPVKAKKLAAQSKKRISKATPTIGKCDVFATFGQWLSDRETGISPLTVQGYLSDLVKFADWFRISIGEAFTPSGVTPVDVRNYKSYLQTVKKFKPATINRRLASLRVFFTWAVNEGLVTDTPIRVHNVEELPTAPKSLDERTYSKLLRMAQRGGDKRTIAIIQLLRHTGLRVAELCNLRLTDLTLSDRKGKVVVYLGKGSRYREVPLNLDARRALQEYLAVRPKAKDDHVFIGQRQNGLTDSAVQRIVAEVGRLAGIDDVTPHVLRHTFGRGLIDAGVDLVTVKTLMGHKRLDSTAHYTKPSASDLEAAVARLEIEE